MILAPASIIAEVTSPPCWLPLCLDSVSVVKYIVSPARGRDKRALSVLARSMPRDQLIGDIIERVADDVRLGADAEHVVAGAPDQRTFPSRRDRT